jgi:hypothetical protein
MLNKPAVELRARVAEASNLLFALGWRRWSVERAFAEEDAYARALRLSDGVGCSLRNIETFFRSFIMLFATPDAQHFRDGGSFTFRASEADFFFSPQQDSFVVTFPTLMIVVGQKDDAVMIQIIRR